jgi:hypothetical protein
MRPMTYLHGFSLLVLIGMRASAQTTPTPAFGFTSSTQNQGNFTVGYQFHTSKTITVNELGKYDYNGGGLNEAAAVGLWRLDGAPLAWATVPSGTAGIPRNGCYYAPITALELPPGGYIIGTQTFAGGEPFSLEGSASPEDGVAWYGARYLSGSALSLPATVSSARAYFGPSFAFTSTRSTNLVQNAGFESTAVADGNFASVTTLPNWTLSGGMVLANDWNGSNWAAADQGNWLSLQALGTPPNATISQTIPTEAGKTYEYSFAYSALDDATARTWTMPCSFGGVARTITINSGHRGSLLIRPWQVASGTFVADGPTATISFTGNQQIAGFYGPIIDQVWVGEVTNTTPRVQSGRWAFDGSLEDVEGVNDGRMVGAETYADGFAGQALTLTGATHVDLGPGIVSTNAYTKVAWVKRSGGGHNNILSGDGIASQHAFYASTGNGFQLAAGHNGAWNTVRDNTAIPDGVWTFVAVTYDRNEGGGTLKLYRNGRLTGGTPVVVNVAPPNGGSALLGGFNGSGDGWTGQIDEVALFDRALSASEIDQMFRDGQRAHSPAYALVPELADYDLVYELPIPTSSALGAAGRPAYSFDNSAMYTGETSFDRVAYYLELLPAGSTTPKWVCVSLDAFTREAGKIGVPAVATGATFQQRVTNLNIASSEPGVTTGTGIATGNIEFWGYNYAQANAALVPNANSTDFDVGDQISTGGTYGSMQIHNHAVNGTIATQTIFAYNRWGYGDASDLGIGNAPGADTDWTFAQNAATYDRRILHVFARKQIMPSVALDTMPKSQQLFPRDRTTDLAGVKVSGRVTTPGCDQASLTVLRLGAPFTNVVQALSYDAGEAPFTFTVPIAAELAGYDFTLLISSNGTDFVSGVATNVVAGDVLLMNGQSNAEARSFSGSANGNRSPWIRSYGTRSSVSAEVTTDTTWHLAEGDAVHAPGAVGQWGLRMGRNLVDATGIPVAILNHAEGGQPISYFQRNESNPADTAQNYGQLLHRVRAAGLEGAVRAIFFYQGESDNGNADVHENGFLQVYRNWLQDYPSVEKIYVCQLHVGCGTTTWTADLRNRQRTWPDRFANIEAMSTTGLPNHDGCHYSYAGYERLGDDMTRLVLRDLHGVPAPPQADPPNPECAYLPDATGTNLVLLTRNSADVLTVPPGAATEFRIEGLTDAVVTAVIATNNTLRLSFDRDIRAGTGLSFSGHAGGAPSISNGLGLGLLSFHNLPILAGLVVPDVPAGLQAVQISSNRTEVTWNVVTNATRYLLRRDGGVLAECYPAAYLDTDPGPHDYQVAAVSPAGTSAWSTVVSVGAIDFPVFQRVPEALDYDVLYALDLPSDLQVGSSLDVPYFIDRSADFTNGIERVAYHLELQAQPFAPVRWAYASMNAFTNNAAHLGVPVLLLGRTFYRAVDDLNVYASAGAGVVEGRHIATGRIEFSGYNYAPTNADAVPLASAADYDHGDTIATTGTYGAMQIHNIAVPQTIFAFNRWGIAGVEDIGIGNAAAANTDWTFSGNALSWQFRRLLVLVLTDTNNNGLPDAWERRHFGSLTAPLGGPGDDYDHDGFTNLQEQLAGTNPDDDTDFLFVSYPVKAGDDCLIRFPTEPARTYRVEYKAELTDPDWTLLATVEGTGAPLEITDPSAALLERRYYRVSSTP